MKAHLKARINLIEKLKSKMPDIVYVYSQNSAMSFINLIKNYKPFKGFSVGINASYLFVARFIFESVANYEKSRQVAVCATMEIGCS